MAHPFTIGAFGIIFDEHERVLLVHRTDYDLWNLPGGGVESSEAPWEAVVREVKEETGFDVTVERLLGIYSKPEKNDIVFSFACTIVGGSRTVNSEARDIQFFSIDDMPHNTSPKHVERIREAYARPSQVIMKIQKGPSSIELLKQGIL